MEQASTAMAEIWAKNLERQTEVIWLMDGSKPLLKIRKDGVLVADKRALKVISLSPVPNEITLRTRRSDSEWRPESHVHEFRGAELPCRLGLDFHAGE